MSLDHNNGLYIAGEYLNKGERCECGADWTHLVIFPTRGWLHVCLHCAYAACGVYDNIEVISRVEVMDIAERRKQTVRRRANKPSRLSSFWLDEVVPWIRCQGRPVTVYDVIAQFDREYDNTRARLAALADKGVLEMTRLKRYNQRAFTVKEQ